MKRLVLESFLLLVYLDWILCSREFRGLDRIVRQERLRTPVAAAASREQLCHAIDIACVLYFKRVLCLQRSAATTLLLRRHGVRGEMVIGAQVLPFKSHAWCEVDGVVVNDKPYVHAIYQILARC
jgi:hypothetical protein